MRQHEPRGRGSARPGRACSPIPTLGARVQILVALIHPPAFAGGAGVLAAQRCLTQCCCPVSLPDWRRRNRLCWLAPAAMQARRCSCVSAVLYSVEAAARRARERSCARRFGIVRFGPAAPALPVASQVPDPITAAPALDGSIKAFSPAAQVRAREAPVGSQVGRQLDTRCRHPLSG